MKTKLFSLFIAVFLFSFSGNAQKTAKTAAFPVITLIGSGNGGWTNEAETEMLTDDGITYTLVDKVLTDGGLKFREGRCWPTGVGACPPGSVTNPYGWGPTDAQFAIDGGWPSGTNAVPVDAGKDILSKAGVWTITFNRIAGTWSFVAGTPLPVIKLVGSAVSTPGGVVLTSDLSGTFFTAKKATLVPGTCQFSVDGVLVGGLTFPTGDAAAGTDAMTITTTGIDYDVTFDYALGKYAFAVATFPTIALVGEAVGGWPGQPGNPGPIDVHQMTTTNGVNYTLNNVPVIPGGCVFRVGNAWDVKYGATAFPTGTNNGGQDIIVPAGSTGTYNVTLNTTTGEYAFSKITYSIVGTGVGGWPGDPGNLGPIDTHQLTTVDGVNYTKAGLVVVGGGAKFRLNNAWAGGDWGGLTFPSGTKTGDNIPTVAGTYNLTVNVLTGAYDFGTALAVKNFNAGSFKAYPNPTKNSWNITSNDDITSVQVFDILGKSVYTKSASSKEVNVNAATLSKGVYFAKVSTANGTSTVKLVKE